MRRLALLMSTAVLLAPASAQAAATVPYGFFGMSVEGALFRPDINQGHEFTLMAQDGVEAVITEVNWAFLQPREDKPPHWGRIDRVVKNAARRGMRVMFNVIYAPTWGATDPGNGASPPDAGKFAGFLRAAVLRYGTKGSFWAANPGLARLYVRDYQVWNEPPSPGFWSQQPFAKHYVDVLRAARFAIKITDARARVVLAGLTWKSWEDLGKIYKAGGQGLFDAVSLHPYTTRPANVKYIVKLNRRVMARNGDAKLPILITEMGWPSAKGRTQDKYGYEVTPAEQAARLREVLPMLAEARTRYRIERVYYHNWISTDTGPRTFNYSGLRRVHGTKIVSKPALYAYRNGVLALEGCRRKGATAKRCG